jgi:hypothetical protein
MRTPKVRKKRGKVRRGRLEWRWFKGFATDMMYRPGFPHQRGSVWYRRLPRTHIVKSMSLLAMTEARLDPLNCGEDERFIVLRRYVDRAGSLIAIRKDKK